MAQKQEVKITYNKGEIFFFAHGFKSAIEHSEEYINRNKNKIDMKVYYLNSSNFGNKWVFIKESKISN